MNRKIKFILVAIMIIAISSGTAIATDNYNLRQKQEQERVENIRMEEENKARAQEELFQKNKEIALAKAKEVNDKQKALSDEEKTKQYLEQQKQFKNQEKELNQVTQKAEAKVAKALALKQEKIIKTETKEEKKDDTHKVSSYLATANGYTDFKVTAYDLSFKSCNKKVTHPKYGITASGYSLKGQTRESAMAIAVDPKVIPLGSKVEIIFEHKDYQKYNGVYIARDTGNAVKGLVIDMFMGDFNKYESDSKTISFGRVKAKIRILK